MRTTFIISLALFINIVFSQTDSVVKTAVDKYKMIERNRNSPLLVFGSEIQQDDKVIGTFEDKTSKDKKTKTLYIYILNGPRVAEATCEGEDCHTWSIVTLKDKSNHAVKSKQGADRKDIVSYLIRTWYL